MLHMLKMATMKERNNSAANQAIIDFRAYEPYHRELFRFHSKCGLLSSVQYKNWTM